MGKNQLSNPQSSEFKTHSALREAKQLATKLSKMDNREIYNFLEEAKRQHTLYFEKNKGQWTIIRLLLAGVQLEIDIQLREAAAKNEQPPN